MSITIEQRTALVKFLRFNKISYQLTSPKTFTESVQNPDAIVINIKDKNKLKNMIDEMNIINKNQNSKQSIQFAVIGGGRGGNNNSYSIGKLWEGVDVFVQLAWTPEFKILPQDEIKSSDAQVICRISPNMMLIELNKYLYDNGYHCPVLFGSLNFMSIAGGLSTGAHTSYGYLSDIVQGLEVLLPNGEVKYFSQKDNEFKLYCQNASFGLLGIITAVDIKVNKESKKLKRIVELSTYDQFLKKIHEEVKKGIPLDSRSVIFSSIELSHHSPVKLTRWEWVSSDTSNQGEAEAQVVDDSIIGRFLLPMLAVNYPKILSKFFNHATLSSSREGITVSSPAEIMGPESKMVGHLTEMGVFFDYNDKLDLVLNKLMKLLDEKRMQHKFPINTAIFLRFPKKRNSKDYTVAMDFASMGLNLQDVKEFVDQMIAYLKTEGIQASLHYGKSNGINANIKWDQSGEGWDWLKNQYQKFYQDYHLDEHILKQRLDALENTESLKCKIELGIS